MPVINQLQLVAAALAALGLLAGCGPREPAAATPETSPTEAAPAATPMPTLKKPTGKPTAPPPGTAVPAMLAVNAGKSAASVLPGRVQLEDREGKMLTNGLAVVQRAVDLYGGRRFSSVDDEGSQPWPPLSSLSQLIQYQIIPRLPPAPPGQEFVLDTNAQRVSLASR